jgi:hypothetical protein
MEFPMNSLLYNASLVAVRDCMGLKINEKVLVVTDEPMRNIGYALWQASKDLGNEVLFVEMLPGKSNGEEPPSEVTALMKLYYARHRSLLPIPTPGVLQVKKEAVLPLFPVSRKKL